MSVYNFVLFLVIFFGILCEKFSQGRTITRMKIDCKNETITTIPNFNVTTFPKYLELFECVINSPIVNDLKTINVSTAALKILNLTYMTTYTALDDKYMAGLTIDALTIKSRTMLTAGRHSLYPLKNLTYLELTNVVVPDLPDQIVNLTLREINTLPYQLSNCKNLKQLNIINWNVNYISQGFLANCTSLKTVFIKFGINRFYVHQLFDRSNISLDYLEIHDDPKLLNTGLVIPMQLSALTFSSITGFKKLNLSYNGIWCLYNDTFTRFHELEVLDLSHNNLFDFDIDNATNLQTLDLSYNPFTTECICRILRKSRTYYPQLKTLIIDIHSNATACLELSWTVISSTHKDKNSNDTTNTDYKNYVLVPNNNKKIWAGLPCTAVSIAVLACIGFVCTVAYVHRRKKKEQEKKRLQEEQNMVKLKLSMERLNVDVEKNCNEGVDIEETTKL